MAGPLTLMIDTTTPRGSLALAGADGGMERREFGSDRSHNSGIFAPLGELVGGLARGEIGLVLVGSGPGSYSGTRVGIAAAQGLGLAHGARVAALPSILALDEALAGAGCLVLGDARRGTWWTARARGGRLEEEPSLTDEAGLSLAVAAAMSEGLALVSFEERARFPLAGEFLERLAQVTPGAAGLWRAWRGADEATREAWLAAEPQPLYLKPPHITAPKPRWPAR